MPSPQPRSSRNTGEVEATESVEDLPELRESVQARSRQEVDISGPVWEMRKRKESESKLSFDTRKMAPSSLTVSGRARHLVKLFLARELRRNKPHTVRNLFGVFRRFFRWWEQWRGMPFLSWGEAGEVTWRAFLEHGRATKGRGNDFSRLRPFYEWGAHEMNLPEFDKKTAATLRSIRAEGNVKGEAVRSWDPLKGPFDDDEVRLITDALEEKVGTPERRAYVHLLLQLGFRPFTFSILRGRHLKKYTSEKVLPSGELGEETVYYHLEVPKLKGRAAEIVEWKMRPITEKLGARLEELRAGDEDLLLPWLMDIKDIRRKVGRELKKWIETAGIVSPRTGELLRVTPTRFRYTVGTRMAIEGASRVEIANALGHTDLQHVEVYIQATGKIIEQIGQDAFDFYDSVVPRFRGKIVESSDPQPHEDMPRKRLPSSAPHLPGAPMPVGSVGSCGHDYENHGPCEFAPPLACYTCPKFAAFDDAPHGKIAEKLEQMIATQDGTNADRRIPHQLEETITAARQVEAQIASEDTEKAQVQTDE